MAKTIDVALTTMENVGTFNVSPTGILQAQIVRGVDDKEIHHTEELYFRLRHDQPMHPNGTTHLVPGQSLSFNVSKRLIVNPDEALVLFQNLEEREGQLYSPARRHVRFAEIKDFDEISSDYSVTLGVSGGTLKFIATYTVQLVSEDQESLTKKPY